MLLLMMDFFGLVRLLQMIIFIGGLLFFGIDLDLIVGPTFRLLKFSFAWDDIRNGLN
jgi:hypothetical protein